MIENMQITITPKGLKEYPFHKHDSSEIVCYLHGEGFMETEQEDIPFQKGTILLLPPNIKHRSKSKNGFKNICVHVEDAALINTKILVGKDNETDDAQTLAKILARAFINKLSGIDGLLTYLYNAYRELVLMLISGNNLSKADILRAEIVANCNNVEYNIASALMGKGISADHLRVIFKQKYGCTPIQYLTNLRIAFACNMFEVYGEEIKVKEVAYASGYTDEFYFSRIFKKIKGITPKEYQRGISK